MSPAIKVQSYFRKQLSELWMVSHNTISFAPDTRWAVKSGIKIWDLGPGTWDLESSRMKHKTVQVHAFPSVAVHATHAVTDIENAPWDA